MQAGVYQIRIGEGYYYGSTKDFHKRELEHRAALIRGNHRNQRLQRSYDKYKEFFFERVIGCHKDQRFKFEQELLDHHQADPKLMNICLIVNKPPDNRGRKHPPRSQAHCDAISARWKGVVRGPMSQEQKDAIGRGLTGGKRSDETKAKMSLAAKKGWLKRKENYTKEQIAMQTMNKKYKGEI